MLPPLIIFKAKRLPNQIETIIPSTWRADKSDSGWMNTETFYSYITEVFYPWITDKSISPPVVLFVDGHVSHKSLKLSEFCLEHKIVLASFLPNATHLQQPMDVVIFKPLKTKWAAAINNYKITNRNAERMPKQDFCRILDQCFTESVTPELMKKSFKSTALFPFGGHNFDFDRLLVRNQETEEIAPSVTAEFVEQANTIIETLFPGRTDQFKQCGDSIWGGAESASDLHLFWKHLERTAEQAGDTEQSANDITQTDLESLHNVPEQPELESREIAIQSNVTENDSADQYPR